MLGPIRWEILTLGSIITQYRSQVPETEAVSLPTALDVSCHSQTKGSFSFELQTFYFRKFGWIQSQVGRKNETKT